MDFSDHIHPLMHYVMHTLIQLFSSMHCSVHYRCQNIFLMTLSRVTLYINIYSMCMYVYTVYFRTWIVCVLGKDSTLPLPCSGYVSSLRLPAARSSGPVCDQRRQSATLVCVQTAIGVLPPQGLRSIDGLFAMYKGFLLSPDTFSRKFALLIILKEKEEEKKKR